MSYRAGMVRIYLGVATAVLVLAAQGCNSRKSACNDLREKLAPAQAARDEVLKQLKSDDTNARQAALTRMDAAAKDLAALPMSNQDVRVDWANVSVAATSFAESAHYVFDSKNKNGSGLLPDLERNAKELDNEHGVCAYTK
jgi:hypothetical protein